MKPHIRLAICLLASLATSLGAKMKSDDVDNNAVEEHWVYPLVTFCADANPLCFLNFESRDSRLWANGEEFHIKGVNWVGSEGRTGAPYGLDQHTVDHYMDFLNMNGFNAIRLLFNHESVITNSVIDVDSVGKATEL